MLRRLCPTIACLVGLLPCASAAEADADTPPAVAADAAPLVIIGTLDEVDTGPTNAQTTMDQEDLDRFDDYSAGHAIKRMVGVTHTGPPGEVKDVRIRGFEKGFTLITIDGLPTATGKNDHQLQMDRLPPDMIERIETRHVPTADQNHDAIAGTVNVVLKQIPQRLHAGVGAQLIEHGGSFGTGVSGYVGDGRGDIGWLAALSVRQRPLSKDDAETTRFADGSLKETKTKFEDATFTNVEFAPRLQWRAAPEVVVGVNGFLSYGLEDKERGEAKTDPNGVLREEKNNPEEKDMTTSRLSTDVTIGPKINQFRLVGGVSFATDNKSSRTEITTKYNGAGAFNGSDIKDIPLDDKEETLWFAKLTHDYQATDAIGLRWGGQWQRREYREDIRDELRKFNASNTLTSTENREETFRNVEYGLDAFVLARLSIGVHHVIPGVRAETRVNETEATSIRTVTPPGTTTDLDAEASGISVDLLPSLHHRWQATDSLAWYSAGARLVRRAKPKDRSPIVNEATTNTLTTPDKAGNPDLDPEHGWALETGVIGEDFGPVSWGVTLYGRWLEDLIEKRTALEGTRYVERPQNIGDGYVLGFEGQVGSEIPPVPGLELWANGGFPVTSRFRDGQTGEITRMTEMPKWVTTVGATQKLLADRLAVSLSLQIRGEIEKHEPNKVEIEEVFAVVDASVRYRIDTVWEVQLSGSNITDTPKKRTTTNTTNGEVTTREEDGNPTFILGVRGKW